MFEGTPFETIEARDCIAFLWAARRPIAGQWNGIWGRLPDREADLALAWWIARAAKDAWTFDQLAEWALARMAAGETLPPLLREFVGKVLRGECTLPPRRKNAADPRRDLMATLAVDRLVQRYGVEQNEARRRVGLHFGMAMQTVESAAKRADAGFSAV